MRMGDAYEKGRKSDDTGWISKENRAFYGYIMLCIGLKIALPLVFAHVKPNAQSFPYPIAWSLAVQALISMAAWALVQAGLVEPARVDSGVYLRFVLPIAALTACNHWLGNTTYMYLGVSVIQLLKAMMPIIVFSVGVLLGTERFEFVYASSMVLVAIGLAAVGNGGRFDVGMGFYGFSAFGALLQLGDLVAESARLSLIQPLLQNRSLRLGPVTMMYTTAPACFGCLLVPFALVELPRILGASEGLGVRLLPLALAKGAAAFAHLWVWYLIVLHSSVVTAVLVELAGGWAVAGLTAAVLRVPVTGLQLAGYAILLLGLCWYRHLRAQDARQQVPAERQPLLPRAQAASP